MKNYKVVMQVVHIRLKPGAEDVLTARAYSRVLEWLKQWTPRNNFKAVLASSEQEALKKCREILQRELVPDWLKWESNVKPEHFEFEVSQQEIEEDQFWMSSAIVWCHWHDIKEST